MDKELLSTKEVAEYLGVSVTTIYQYVKNKKIKPVYEDWTIDETMLFYLSDVDELKNERPSGYTTAQVADELGVHQTTIAKQIKDGKIKASKVKYRGRMTYFVSEDVLKELKQSYGNNHWNRDSFYQKSWGYYLFQSFQNDTTKEFARVMSVTKDSGYIVTDNGKQIEFEQLREQGFYPNEEFPIQKRLNKPGYVSFLFEQPSSFHSPIYEVIESFYRTVGYKNMYVYLEKDVIHLHIKPFLWKGKDEYFSLLEDHVIEGSVKKRHNGILLDSGQDRLTIYLPREQKKALQKEARGNKITIDEVISRLVEKELRSSNPELSSESGE